MEEVNKRKKKKKVWYKRKKFLITLSIIIVLVAGRIYLPYFVKDTINKTLSEIPGYYGQVDDVHISLWRGAYQFEDLYLDKVESQTKTAFLNFPLTDISVQWRAILDGKIVAEIDMESPEVTYIFEDHVAANGELDEPDVDVWTKVLTDLVPLDINRFTTTNGKLKFVALYADPNIDLFMNDVEIVATNLRNVEQSERSLPSDFEVSATTIGNGLLTANGKLDLIKEIPDMNMELSIEDADIKALNDLTLHFAGIDFEEGTFELYSELAIADSYMKGYFKPFFIDSKIVDGWDKEDSNIFKKMWEGFVGIFKFLLKNQGNDTLATKIPIEGPLDNSTVGVWSSVFNVFENGWFNAFDNSTDDTIDFKDAEKGADAISDRKSRKEKRLDRREQRKIDRVERRAKRRNYNDDDTDDINVEIEIKEIKDEIDQDRKEMDKEQERDSLITDQ